MKPPIPNNEVARLKTLCKCNVLDTAPEQAYDDITTLAANICGTSVSVISLVDANRQWFKSKVGLDASETARDIAFCAYAILQPDIFIVNNALLDERFATNPLVASEPYIRFYAGVPLITADGYGLGTLCVIDFVPRELTSEQVNALKSLGRQTLKLLEQRLKSGELEGTPVESKQAPKKPDLSFKQIAPKIGLALAALASLGLFSYLIWTNLIQNTAPTQQYNGFSQDKK